MHHHITAPCWPLYGAFCRPPEGASITILNTSMIENCPPDGSVNIRSTEGQHKVNRRSTETQQKVNKSTEGQQNVNRRSTEGQQKVYRNSTEGQQNVNRRSTECQQKVNRWSTQGLSFLARVSQSASHSVSPHALLHTDILARDVTSALTYRIMR
jgi:hypothetical protein